MDNECKELASQQPGGDAVMVAAVNVATREVTPQFMASLSEMMKNTTAPTPRHPCSRMVRS